MEHDICLGRLSDRKWCVQSICTNSIYPKMTYRFIHALPEDIRFSAYRRLNYEHGLMFVKINDRSMIFMRKKICYPNDIHI